MIIWCYDDVDDDTTVCVVYVPLIYFEVRTLLLLYYIMLL